MEFLKFVFWEMPLDMWQDGFLGKCIASLYLAMLVFIATLIGMLGYMLVDTVGLSYRNRNAVVIQHRFEPAHNVTTLMLVGKSMVPIIVHHDNEYYLTLKVDELFGEDRVSKDWYESTKDGDTIPVEYSKNRFSDNLTFNKP